MTFVVKKNVKNIKTYTVYKPYIDHNIITVWYYAYEELCVCVLYASLR